jgi:2-C-methyl-D-erythritol 4-phosphate cytidylyltransferase
MHSQEYALIVAGGKGTRIKSKLPKQFLELNGLPILMHSINAFYRYSEKIVVILVLPEDDIETWRVLCQKHNFTSTPYSPKRGRYKISIRKKRS